MDLDTRNHLSRARLFNQLDPATWDETRLQQILQQDPALASEPLMILGQWLHQQNKTVDKACKVVTVIVQSPVSAVQNLPAQLAKTLATKGTTQHLCQALEGPQPLNQRNSDYILLETSDKSSPWRDFCLRQADKVLYLVAADDKPLPLSVHLGQSVCADTERELVLVHPTSTLKPGETHRWLKYYDVQRHHHIRADNKADIARLAREISGDAIALVLGGGGARSFAQIGVLKAMEEVGLTVDRIAGTSMGAIIGAQYADGYTPEQLLALNQDIWARNKPHRAFTLPITSLLSARRAKRLTQNVFGDKAIEDLWTDFFCISSDLTHLKPHVHEQGLLWSALLASGAIPGVCPSIVSEHGALLVDGGLLDNLPVAAMKKRHSGPVIAVDVTSSRGLKPNVTTTIPPNGWRALWAYLNPLAKQKRYPHLLKLLSHTASLSAKVNAASSRQLADLCLTPPCHQFKAMDMRNIEKLAEHGYHYALPRLEQWLNRSD